MNIGQGMMGSVFYFVRWLYYDDFFPSLVFIVAWFLLRVCIDLRVVHFSGKAPRLAPAQLIAEQFPKKTNIANIKVISNIKNIAIINKHSER